MKWNFVTVRCGRIISCNRAKRYGCSYSPSRIKTPSITCGCDWIIIFKFFSDYLTYSHGLVSSLPPVNYSRASMNFIDHTYIGVLPRSVHTTIRQYSSAFSQQQQRAHNNHFFRPSITPHIMSVFRDAAKTQTALLRTLNCLNPPNNMKFYRLISKAWNKVLIALLQRARNIQTIIDALVFNQSRTDTTRPNARRVPATIPQLYHHYRFLLEDNK